MADKHWMDDSSFILKMAIVFSILIVSMMGMAIMEAHEKTKRIEATTPHITEFCEKHPNGVVALTGMVAVCNSATAEGRYNIQD